MYSVKMFEFIYNVASSWGRLCTVASRVLIHRKRWCYHWLYGSYRLNGFWRAPPNKDIDKMTAIANDNHTCWQSIHEYYYAIGEWGTTEKKVEWFRVTVIMPQHFSIASTTFNCPELLSSRSFLVYSLNKPPGQSSSIYCVAWPFLGSVQLGIYVKIDPEMG